MPLPLMAISNQQQLKLEMFHEVQKIETQQTQSLQ
jgi:hypothetical protein